MAEFTDRQGRRWRLAIDGSHVLTAKRTFGVNLPGMFARGLGRLQSWSAILRSSLACSGSS